MNAGRVDEAQLVEVDLDDRGGLDGAQQRRGQLVTNGQITLAGQGHYAPTRSRGGPCLEGRHPHSSTRTRGIAAHHDIPWSARSTSLKYAGCAPIGPG